MTIAISSVARVTASETDTEDAAPIVEAIRQGNWRVPVEQIRHSFQAELAKGKDLQAAKKAIAGHKKKLPAVMWSGQFKDRKKPVAEKLVRHSGLLCADLDDLGERLATVRARLQQSPHLFALFTSPSGHGLKAVFRVQADASKHAASFRAVQAHVRELAGHEIDGQCSDLTRLCFVSFDADALLNPNAVELAPAPAPTDPDFARPLRIDPPTKEVTFEQWKSTIASHFPALGRTAETCGSVVVQLLINDVANPFALGLVDVPSSGKTISLNFFDVPDLTYTTDSFTPASFVSHATNVKRNQLASVDMLPRIRFKTLIVRDLAPIFGSKEDDLIKSLGILTRALDGEGLETDSGVHGQRAYKGDYLFMLLAATTPIPPRVHHVMGTIGSRLFFLSLHTPAKSHDELIAQIRGPARRDKQRLCREATDAFFRTLWAANPNGVDWDREGDPHDCLLVITRCAELLAGLRGAIQVWHNQHDNTISHNVPVVEMPDRISCLLYNLARGHALVCGRRQISTEDLAPVLEVTLDSAPAIRSRVFRALLANKGALMTGEIEAILKCSKPTALKEMKALSVLGVAEENTSLPEHSLHLAPKFAWFLTPECKALRWTALTGQGGKP